MDFTGRSSVTPPKAESDVITMLTSFGTRISSPPKEALALMVQSPFIMAFDISHLIEPKEELSSTPSKTRLS